MGLKICKEHQNTKYHAGRIILSHGFSVMDIILQVSFVEEPGKKNKCVLALMIPLLMVQPAFAVRLIPVFSLKADFPFNQRK